MKNFLFLFFLMLTFTLVDLNSQSKMSIGRCTFEGKQPTTIVSTGTLTIYHNGSMKRTGTNGGVNIWSGNGDVWVIFSDSKDISKFKFITNGKVQTCVK
jgi:hypothetical protein